MRDDPSLLSDQDLYLFNEGTHLRLWEKLGAHPVDGGTYFAVWAPNAERVSVIGDFNDWDPERHPLRSRDRSGVWEGVVPGVSRGARYKYRVTSRYGGYRVDKADPLGLYHESPPQTASRVWSLEYAWGDGTWMADRGARDAHHAPMSDLRDASRLVAAEPGHPEPAARLSRARAAARRVRARHSASRTSSCCR